MGLAYVVDRPAQRPAARTVTYREALLQTMREALAGDPDVILLGQGVDDHKGIFGSTLGLADEFGRERVIDTPLAEEGMTGVAVGAALGGLYPIQTHIRADFALLAMNQLVNLAAKYRYMFGGRFAVPMLVRMIVGRSWGQGAQHSQSLQSLFAHVPGLLVVMPSTAESILSTYPWLIANHRGPVLALEHRLLYDLSFRVDEGPDAGVPAAASPLGSRRLRGGSDVTVVATSIMVLEALRAAEHLAHVGAADVEVIDLHCVSHPDVEMILDSVARTGRLLVADTSWRAFGVAAEVCRLVCERDPGLLRAPVRSLGMAPAPCPTAKALEDLFYPSLRRLTDDIAKLVTGRELHRVPLPGEESMADVYKRFKGPF
ncbi:MAG: transketolase C-terminal domain-containing protein [Thermodesulfobacteriota bacterium]